MAEETSDSVARVTFKVVFLTFVIYALVVFIVII